MLSAFFQKHTKWSSLQFSFHQPDADIASLLPVIVACFTPGPLLAAAAAHWVIKKVSGKFEFSKFSNIFILI